MKMSRKVRRIILAVSLVITLVLGYQASTDEAGTAVAIELVMPSRAQSHSGPNATENAAKLEIPHLGLNATDAWQERDLFQPTSWLVPPPIVPASVALISNQGPPPIIYMFRGRLVAENREVAILEKQGEQITVARGDILDGIYRVDDIDTQGVTLMHLPLNMKQAIVFQE